MIKSSINSIRVFLGSLTMFGSLFSPVRLCGQANAPTQASSPILVDVSQLRSMQEDARTRILDARSQDEYAKGHIAGAVWVDVSSWQELGKSQGGFHDVDAWRDKVNELGINNDSQVVVYGNRLPDAARIWWTLKYVGLNDVKLLDGGWQIWLNENGARSTVAPTVAKGNFSPRLDASRLAELDELRASLNTGKVQVVDARGSDEFTGQEIRGKRGGHIPGAVHLDWNDLLADGHRFKSPDRLREMFRQRGILPDETAVCY
jgi:thiosulfate/3-mercaptopyruvate sulfurtransferase